MIRIRTDNPLEIIERNDTYDVICITSDCTSYNDNVLTHLYKELRKKDLETDKNSIYKLGEYSYIYLNDKKLKIVNLYTHFNAIDCPEYTALGLAVRNLLAITDQYKRICILFNNNFFNENYRQVLLRECESYSCDIYCLNTYSK